MSQNRRSKVETEGGRRRDGEEEEEEISGSRSFHDREEEDDDLDGGNGNSSNNIDNDSDDDDDDKYHDDDDDDDDFSSSDSSDDDDDDEEAVRKNKNNRSILWLCQEGQIKVARKRFQALLRQQQQQQQQEEEINNDNVTNDNNNNNTTTDHSQLQLLLKKEIFRIDKNDKNYAIHELLMGGTNDNNSYELVNLILETSSSSSSKERQWNGDYLTMLIAQPPSHRRTALHWATWSNTSIDIIQKLVLGNPEALVIKDGINQGSRTPLELYKHYYGYHLLVEENNNDLSLLSPNNNSGSRYIIRRRTNTRSAGTQQQQEIRPNLVKEKIDYLEKTTKIWIQHRLRLEIYRCAIRLFRKQNLVPFNQQHRKSMKIKPQPWFFISILGYLLQREIQPLAIRILSFVGKDAKVCYSSSSNNNKRKKKRKR